MLLVIRLPLPLSVAFRFLRHEPRKRDGVRLALATLLLRVRPSRSGIRVWISAPDASRTDVWVWNYVDALVLREIYLDRDYRIPDGPPPTTILDLGANIGISVRFLRHAFPDALIIAVEPDSRQFARLLRNIGSDQRVFALHAAVAPRSGPVTFYEARQGWASSIYRPPTTVASHVVRGLSLADILAQVDVTRVDAIKIDVEGSEWDLLRTCQLHLATRWIVGELHHRTSEESVDAARRLLDGWEVAFHKTKGGTTNFTAVRL